VIALTAHVIGVQASTWRAAGMSDYLAKPFTLKALAEMLERWVAPRSTAEPPPDMPQPAQRAAPRCNVIDREILDPILKMDKDGMLLRRIVGLFMAEAPALLSRLDRTLRQGPAQEIAAAAHALKSMSVTIGAQRLADLCAGIEATASNRDASGNGTTLGEIEAELGASIEALQALARAHGDRFAAAARTRVQHHAA
jgi:HPt (histidine-containing phosphotransfer) domain-containing protein